MGDSTLFSLLPLLFFGAVVWMVISRAKIKRPQMACTACGTVAGPMRWTKGSMGIELILWLCFLIPGLIYSLWRLGTRRDVCSACHSEAIVPVHSPVGQRIAKGDQPALK